MQRLISPGIWFLLIVLFCMSCSDHGGIGHEGEAKITGELVFQDGTPASQACVELYPQDYDPVKSNDNVPLEKTDKLGIFTFSDIKPGTYNVYAVHQGNGQKTLINGIEVSEDTMTVVNKRVLQKTGAIKVLIPSEIATVKGYIYIPGTDMFTFINTDVAYACIDSIPAGTIPEIVYSATDDTTTSTLRYDIPVRSENVVTVFNPGWKFTRDIIINTSASGAAVTENVTHFPVCIRLRSSNFNFTDALPDGSDMRFTKIDDTPLPFEIERWDRQTEQADIWVNIDTVCGDNSVQTFRMYWGNELAKGESNSSKVFDTASGYIAVWHCSNQVHDASANGHNSITCSATDAIGAIGFCKKFNGSDSIVIPGLLGSPSSLTLSAWAQLDSTYPGGGSDIVSIGDAALIRMDYEVDSTGTIGSSHRSDGTYFANTESKRFLKKSGWHFLTFSINTTSNTHTLYIDGVLVNSKNYSDTLNYNGIGKNTVIGNHANKKTNFGFIGCIDEVRVYKGAVSADYVKLCFMNQKMKNALIQFK
ncbi:MAG TPA: DUF2341 domain-containing protein [Chitinispirillaceae bacterium]|nr:DUF2341 domain-containing protein [Chitinispirillaceae bacterium]